MLNIGFEWKLRLPVGTSSASSFREIDSQKKHEKIFKFKKNQKAKRSSAETTMMESSSFHRKALFISQRKFNINCAFGHRSKRKRWEQENHRQNWWNFERVEKKKIMLLCINFLRESIHYLDSFDLKNQLNKKNNIVMHKL